jgi:hypothetical protein
MHTQENNIFKNWIFSVSKKMETKKEKKEQKK